MDRGELLKELHIDRSTAGARRRSRAGWIALVVLLLALAGGALWFAFARSAPLTVRVAVARASRAGGEASVLDASGYVTARRQATVSAKITGKVVEVNIEEGMRVAEGFVLARLDDTEVKAQLSLARAQLSLARAQLAATRSQLGEIRAQLVQADKDLARQEELYRKDLVSAQSLDAARAQRDTLRAREATNEEQIRVAQESVASAEVQLDNTVIRAPFAGVVVAKAAQPGEMVSPLSAGGGFTRTGIGTIVDMDSLEIQVDVNEAFINRVTAGQPVEATLNAYPEWKIPGAVIAIIPTADRSKATVKVRVAIKARDSRIVPDMGVRVAFLEPRVATVGKSASSPATSATSTPPAAPGTKLASVVVPAAAVRGDGSQAVAFVYRNGRVERRALTLGSPVGANREVTSGLADGDRVVLSPPDSLKDGDPVKLAEGA